MTELEKRPEPLNIDKLGQRPAYLDFEDFSHTGLGLETYADGLQHPIELRRILTGDLSCEMTVSFRSREEEDYRALDYPPPQPKKGVEIFDSLGRSIYNQFGLPQVPAPRCTSRLCPGLG